MMYIWELLIHALQEHLDETNITFRYPKRLSPYQEMSFENINTVDTETEIDVNPYYRFYAIFQDFFGQNGMEEYQEIQEVLYDLVLHFLARLDSNQGMTKREYYIKFVIQDIRDGIFGIQVKKDFFLLSEKEQKIVANNILRLYMTGEGVYLFQDTVKKLYRNASILANAREKDLVILYLQEKETDEQKRKMQLLTMLFLPFKYEMELYWEHLFGVIGTDNLMRQESMILY